MATLLEAARESGPRRRRRNQGDPAAASAASGDIQRTDLQSLLDDWPAAQHTPTSRYIFAAKGDKVWQRARSCRVRGDRGRGRPCGRDSSMLCALGRR